MSKQVLQKLKIELKEHWVDYLLFGAISILVLVLLVEYNHNRSAQIILLFMYAVSYILWGIMHHAKEKTLHHKVTLEYILIAGCILVTLVFTR